MIEDEQADEFRRALKEPKITYEPSDDERRNGWTTESLTAYIAEQNASRALRIDPHSALNRAYRRPVKAKSKYNPFRWR